MQATDDRKKILVVEDEGLIADDIRRRLERFGYAVPATASSGEEALRMARSLSFDLVLMDIRLKGEMDGIAVAQQLRDELRAPVVYLTAHADQDTISRATLTEPFGYILKPIADGNLRSTVQIALYKHEMERRLRVSEAWLSTTLRSIGDGILATDPDGEIVFMNAVAARLTGWTPEEARGRELADVAVLLDEATGERAANPIFDPRPDETRGYVLVRRDGERTPVEAACFENRDDRELLGAILLLRDIRARREGEERQTQSQRMDAIAGLAAGMSDDFEQLLAALSGLCAEDRKQAALIRQCVSRAGALGVQFSALSRRDRPHAQTIDVHEAIQEFRDSISVCLGRKIALDVKLGPATGFIQADPNRFQQVLIQLALHARQAMPEGGRFTIEASIVDGERWYERLRFTDTGPAMDRKMLSGIFEPAFGGERNRFGLSIAHAIVEQAGGSIRAAAGTGTGTVFEILWPCMGTHQGVTGLVGRCRAIPAVLVIEGEDGLRRAMSTCLEEDGYQVLAAKNVEHGEWASAAYGRPIAAVVTEEGGAALAERLKAPALVLSGYRHDRAPGEQALLKPFPMDELRRRVRALLEQAPA